MKRFFTLILALALCLSMVACGGNNTTGNPDHDYVIALMEKGDYAMAITVLEHLMEENGDIPDEKDHEDTDSSADAPAESTAPAAPATEPPITAEPPVVPANDAERRQLAIDTLCQFMADKGDDFMKAYKKQSGSKGKGPVVIDAIEYWLDDWDFNGNNVHCLMISLEMDVFDGSGFVDGLQLVLDMETQRIYNSAELDWNVISSGDPQSTEEFYHFLVNAYASHVLYDADILWTDRETFEELSADDILAMNDALK